MNIPAQMENLGQLTVYYKLLAAYFEKVAEKSGFRYRQPSIEYTTQTTDWMECDPFDEIQKTVEHLYGEVFELPYTNLQTLQFVVDASGDCFLSLLEPMDVIISLGKERGLEILEVYNREESEFDYEIDFDIEKADAVYRKWHKADSEQLSKALRKKDSSAEIFFATMLNVMEIFFSEAMTIAKCNFPLFCEMYVRYHEYINMEPGTESCCIGRGYMMYSSTLYELLYPSQKKGNYKKRRKKALRFVKALEKIVKPDTFFDGVCVDHHNKIVSICTSMIYDADYDAFFPMNNIIPSICPVFCELDRYLEQVTNN